MRTPMKILYHLPILPPKSRKMEAYCQEVDALSSVFNGQTVWLNPNRHIPSWLPLRIPRVLFGFQMLPTLLQAEKQADLNQFYNPDPYYFPVLSCLKKPIVYVMTGSIDTESINPTFFRRIDAVAVYDKRMYNSLCQAGIGNVYHIQAGIDTSHFSHQPLTISPTIHLLMASAPWTEKQFASKGIDTLLEVVKQMPGIRLTFLWRGLLLRGIQKRIKRLGLQDRVKVIDRLVDVNQILATVHGTILLASRGDIVKAYPHSLLDSLAAGKPVITSRAIPMSDDVEEKGVGCVVEELTTPAVILAVENFVANYAQLCVQTKHHGCQAFNLEQMRNAYRKLYLQLL